MLEEAIEQPRVTTLITAIVRLSEIARPGAAERIASILTRTRLSRIYLVLLDELQPRQQRTDAEALAGAMSLISMLEQTGSKVLVAFSGLDMLLWKAAGASDLATGKFFNLRRFVPGRWDEPAEGARVLAYWTDGELVAWLREEDVRLLLRLGLIDRGVASANPYSRAILEALDRRAGEAWLKWSWRQYLYWFGQRESEIASDRASARNILARADNAWRTLDQKSAYLFDRANDGCWVRAWLNALLLA
jgi:hypothetical protein